MSGDGNRWELKLGLAQVVVVVGVVTGSMVGAFVFGYLSGQKVGYDRALVSSLANTARYPIAGDAYQNDVSPESVSEVYAKLNDKVGARPEAVNEQPELPELSSIKKTTDAPVIEDLASALIQDDSKKKSAERSLGREGLEKLDRAPQREGQPAAAEGRTLGALVGRQDQPQQGAKGVPAAVSLSSAPAELEKQTGERAQTSAKLSQQQEAPAAVKLESGKKDKPQAAAKKSVGTGWYAQVAAPSKLQDAQRLASELKASGFPVVVETANIGGQEYYRVLAGPESSRTLADRLVRQLSREKVVQNKPFTKYVP